MLKLGAVLDEWKPKPGRGTDPLVAVRAVWPELVGADVARAAQPVAIERDHVLIVLTSSPAWSHQLAFLEPEIVRGLSALPETQALTRLRFRVGKLRAASSAAGGAGGPRSASEHVPSEAPARTLDDALSRLRRSVERAREVHRAAGGTFCALCDAPVDGGTTCLPCRDDDERRRIFACERLLFEAPWLTPEEVIGSVGGLDAAAYDRTRRRLLRAWWDEMRRAQALHKLRRPTDRVRLRKLASSFVLLETRIDPNRLEMDSAVRVNALGELYDFVREIEQT
ncbi:MAG TPA: DUF721 domain-containing protein [Candidatus Elarobacter sp.]|nr:DUF721 domain-containing protein [Candidatus Elarobacter sp.]